MTDYKKITLALLCGLMGCLCFGVGDWLMLYGDTTYLGTISWLTVGVTQIAPWRNSLAMMLAFPGIIFYGISLFAIGKLIKSERKQKAYHYLTAFSLTPWLCLHLFYIVILYGFAWMSSNGYDSAALPVSEAIISHFSWIVPVSEVLMLPPYLYWAWIVLRGQTVLPRQMALSNPLIFYLVLKFLTLLTPDCAFRLAFTNGLMSESMVLWFGSISVWLYLQGKNDTGRRKQLEKE
ncbi:MAG: hypothetical protein LUE20_03945 [Oscillospiraceae bacterium]|nr:hypothetical protein [Oscillospiraceae bacterium]